MKRERFVSKLLRMKSFTAQFDAYKRITQQQHRNIISDFAWFYSIRWSQKRGSLNKKFAKSGVESERTNL